jgi:UDP:flavonoid glycosyltransferase YjiC (YdhE family)
MRIAQLAPLTESVPPKLYGGTERVVAWLVDELVERGHDVTLFASGDSRTRGKPRPLTSRSTSSRTSTTKMFNSLARSMRRGSSRFSRALRPCFSRSIGQSRLVWS